MTCIGNVDRYHYIDQVGGSFSSAVLVHVGALCRFVTVFVTYYLTCPLLVLP